MACPATGGPGGLGSGRMRLCGALKIGGRRAEEMGAGKQTEQGGAGYCRKRILGEFVLNLFSYELPINPRKVDSYLK